VKLDKQLQKLDIYEYDDLESQRLYDEVKEKIVQALRATGIDKGYLDPTTFTKRDLGIKATAEIYQAPDGAIGSEEIQREIDRVAKRANKFSYKESRAIDFIKYCMSAGFYGYLRLRKWLGIPLESFTVRTWYAGYLPRIPLLVNPGGEIKLREGTFNLLQYLILKDNIKVCGTGKATELKLQDNISESAIIINYAASVGSGSNSNIQVSDLVLNGNMDAQTAPWSSNADALIIRNVSFSLFKNIEIKNVVHSALLHASLESSGNDTTKNTNNFFENVVIHDNTDSTDLVDVVGSNLVFRSIVLYNGQSSALTSGALRDSIIDTIISYDNGSFPISLEGFGTFENIVINNFVSRNSSSFNLLGKSATGGTKIYNVILNNIIIESTTGSSYGVKITDSEKIKFKGKIFNAGGHGLIVESTSEDVTIDVEVHNSGLKGVWVDGTGDFYLRAYVNNSSQHGIHISDSNNGTILGTVKNSGTVASSFPGLTLDGACSDIDVLGGKYYDDQTTKTQDYGIYIGGTSDYISIVNSIVSGNKTGTIYVASGVNQNGRIINCIGYNPVGNFTAPAIPASGTELQNTYGYPCLVTVYGGTVTDIAVGHSGSPVSTGLTTGTFVLAPGEVIVLTYSAAPSWKWYGL